MLRDGRAIPQLGFGVFQIPPGRDTQRAVEAARESKARADRVRQVSEQGRARIKEVERETGREVKQRVAEAEKAAAELVKREREAAEADAEDERMEIEEEV